MCTTQWVDNYRTFPLTPPSPYTLITILWSVVPMVYFASPRSFLTTSLYPLISSPYFTILSALTPSTATMKILSVSMNLFLFGLSIYPVLWIPHISEILSSVCLYLPFVCLYLLSPLSTTPSLFIHIVRDEKTSLFFELPIISLYVWTSSFNWWTPRLEIMVPSSHHTSLIVAQFLSNETWWCAVIHVIHRIGLRANSCSTPKSRWPRKGNILNQFRISRQPGQLNYTHSRRRTLRTVSESG